MAPRKVEPRAPHVCLQANPIYCAPVYVLLFVCVSADVAVTPTPSPPVAAADNNNRGLLFAKTGVTGPWMLGVGVASYVLSKELYVFNSEVREREREKKGDGKEGERREMGRREGGREGEKRKEKATK